MLQIQYTAKKKVIIFLNFALSTPNDLVCTKLCFMPWKCAYVSDLLQGLNGIAYVVL